MDRTPTNPANITSPRHGDDNSDDNYNDTSTSFDDDSDYNTGLDTDGDNRSNDDANELLPALENQNDGQMQSQDDSPLFCLPAELRDKIYKYTFEGRDGQYSCHNDDAPEHAKTDLLTAVDTALSKNLLWTCRRANSEGRGIFVEAQRDFWKRGTFTLSFVSRWLLDKTNRHCAFTLLESLRNEQIRNIASIAITIAVNKTTTLNILLTPCTIGDLESWTTSRNEIYQWHYSDSLDSLKSLLSANQHCHDQCRPLLAYQQVAARIREEMWHGTSDACTDKGRCVVCSGYVDCMTAGDRRSDLLTLVAWTCAMFEVML